MEELPQQNLDPEDKVRIIKGLILIFLFSSVVISSMVYYNAPNYNPNLVFEGHHNEAIKHHKHMHDNPVYRLQSRYSTKNYVELDLKLERVGNLNKIEAEVIRNLKLQIKLAKNKARISIIELGNKENAFIFPNLYENADLELESDGKIDSLAQSNIGIHIVNHPFSFYLYRKDTKEVLFDTTHSKESKNLEHYFFYAKNYIQISTRLPKGHHTFGLGERFTSLRLNKGRYVLYSADRTNNRPVGQETANNAYSSMPSYMSVNPDTSNAYGAFMMNSSPMEVILEEDYLTYKLTSGLVNLYVFNGPRPREVIIQMQKTFGMPFLPPYSAINWGVNMVSNQPKRDLLALRDKMFKDNSNALFNYPIEEIWVDYSLPVDANIFSGTEDYIQSLEANGYKIFSYRRSPLAVNSPHFESARNKSICITKENGDTFIGRTNNGDVCFIDYFSPNTLKFIKNVHLHQPEFKYGNSSLTLLMNEPTQICDGDCDNLTDELSIKLPYVPGSDKYTGNSDMSTYSLESQTLPLSARQSSDPTYPTNVNNMLNTHNIYSFQETKTYYHALIDSGIERPVIFSRSLFYGNQKFSGKWLGYLDSSWEGLKLAIIQTLNFNLYGNPNTIHEACGYSIFSPNPSDKIRERNEELCIRWLQFAAINPFARFNDFELIPYMKDANRKAVEAAFALRAKLSVYIYSYMIRNTIEGGPFLKPMFAEYRPEKNIKDELYYMDTQFMFGSNFLASPVVTYNERNKKTYFPSDRFYDFYTGRLVNDRERYITVDAPLDKLPLFIRAGFVTPIQSLPDKLRNFNELRKRPLELIIALDQNYRSAGTIYLDDGVSQRIIKEKEYLYLDVTTLQDLSSKDIEILFRKFDNDYKIADEDMPLMNKIHIYGMPRLPYRIYFQAKESLSDISSDSAKYDQDDKVLIIDNLNLSLNDSRYKIVLQVDWS